MSTQSIYKCNGLNQYHVSQFTLRLGCHGQLSKPVVYLWGAHQTPLYHLLRVVVTFRPPDCNQ